MSTEDTAATQTQGDEETISSNRKAVAAGAVGAGLENFDFSIFGYLAATVSVLFFPQGDATAALLATFSAFAVGFVARPVGGVLLGPVGDKLGRRTALVAIIILMAVATLSIGLLPTYAQIGTLAAVLLFGIRFIQGFASGGDFGNSGAFIVEYAPDGKRGFYGSWQQVALLGGALLASAAVALWTSIISEEALSAWGWRVPFLIAAIPAAFAIYLRVTVDESPEFREMQEGEAEESESNLFKPLIDAIVHHWKPTLAVVGVYAFWVALGVTIIAYTVAYTTTQTELPLSTALTANTIALVIAVALVPFMGAMSDRVGRKPLMMASCASGAVLAYPAFLLFLQGTFASFFIGSLLLAVPYSLMAGPAPAAFSELFPTYVRVSALTTGSNIAIVAFGGTTPLVATWLISRTGFTLAPSFWLIALGVVAFLTVAVAFEETAKSPLKR